MVKKGDTLIEVLLAVGIFSMIAISVVAVMSGGTSSAQTALETTLAREEIDAQAEALRYIHDSYINDKNSEREDLATVSLWRKIVSPSNVYLPTGDNEDEAILQYTPTSCPIDASELPDGAFILDTRALNLENGAAYKSLKEGNVFAPVATFPRLIFGTDENNLVSSDTSTLLSRAEGIYIIAVADKDTTTIISESGKKYPAFYDFYIRTCWYGTDNETPSTISTVIRLYNPEAGVIDQKPEGVDLRFGGLNNSYVAEELTKTQFIKKGTSFEIPNNNYVWGTDNYGGDIWFVGWSIDPNTAPEQVIAGAPGTYKPGDIIEYDVFKNLVGEDGSISLYPIWDSNKSRQYWLDVNVFLNQRETQTSGHGSEGFKVKVYINGQISPSTNNNDGDWYAEVPIGSRVQVVLNGPSGYHIPNKSSICGNTKGCSYSYSPANNSYTVTFYIIPDSLSTILDSSGHNAIQIEPIWVKK